MWKASAGLYRRLLKEYTNSILFYSFIHVILEKLLDQYCIHAAPSRAQGRSHWIIIIIIYTDQNEVHIVVTFNVIVSRQLKWPNLSPKLNISLGTNEKMTVWFRYLKEIVDILFIYLH